MKENNTSNTTKRIVIAAMLAALTCVATMIIKIPSPLKGYLNLGDCVVLLAGVGVCVTLFALKKRKIKG